ncbi:pyruvate formate lyase family protein [Eubacterium ramulus]|uniref:pyruvate formate lyase family protein n=1 Tax=Eubacterium ramulus TaxID=39490 RepID=UPI00351F8A76
MVCTRLFPDRGMYDCLWFRHDFDQYMWAFYKKDVIDEKSITRDEALEMLECLYLKACEVYEVRDSWYATAFAGYPMWEILVVGGQTPDGKDACN